jgi:predicted TIM-barrel fold metal-dependent hydrolase
MIIDCHCHAGKGDGLTGPWDTAAPLDRYVKRATRAGIERSVLFPAFHSDYAVANCEVARIIASRPEQFYGFAFVHADRDRGRVRELVRVAVENYGFRGIKVHRYDARLSREICEIARSWQIPVLYDPMGEVSIAELLASEYPDVDFIFAHLGSFSDDWKAQMAMIDPLVRHANIHADTSGVRRFDVLQEAVERAGPEKLLFGSDGPWLHPGLELAKVVALGLNAMEQSLILGGNLLRLISKRRARPAAVGRAPVGLAGDSGAFRDPWFAEMPG